MRLPLGGWPVCLVAIGLGVFLPPRAVAAEEKSVLVILAEPKLKPYVKPVDPVRIFYVGGDVRGTKPRRLYGESDKEAWDDDSVKFVLHLKMGKKLPPQVQNPYLILDKNHTDFTVNYTLSYRDAPGEKPQQLAKGTFVSKEGYPPFDPSRPGGARMDPGEEGRARQPRRDGGGGQQVGPRPGAASRFFDPQPEAAVKLQVRCPNPVAVERFLREARAVARLQHPHIVPVYEAGQDGERHYIAAAFIEGRTLAAAVEEAPLDFRTAAAVVRDLAEALAYAHGEGVVHRDVKPANVLLDRHGRPHLADFGLAHVRDTSQALTHEGAVLGTPGYMAPEQAAGRQEEPRPASDQYSLGVVLYELLCGETPFDGPPPVVLYNAIHTEPPPPSRARPGVPRELETICLKAMAKRPEDRYAGCRELADSGTSRPARSWVPWPTSAT